MAETARRPTWPPTATPDHPPEAQRFDARRSEDWQFEEWRDDYLRRNRRWPTLDVVWDAGYRAALQAVKTRPQPCPHCAGKGSFKGEYVPDGWGTTEYVAPYPCRYCRGTGVIGP
jgi:hypothetical protein